MALGQMVSPGVYTRIIDLSEYLADIPGTIGFIPILSKKGPDNKLMIITSKEQFINLYGEPNILDYGKAFGQGPYVAWQHLGVSSQLYVLRALPQDATYSHLVIGMQLVNTTLNTSISSSSQGIPFTILQMNPMYMDGQNHIWQPDPNGGVDGSLSYVCSAGKITGVSVYSAGTGYTNGTHPTTILKNGGVAGVLTYVVSGNAIVSATVTNQGTGYNNGTFITEIGEQQYPYPSINHIKELKTLFYDYRDNTTPFMHLDYDESTTGMGAESTGGVGVPNGILMYFRAIGRGSSYNDFAIKLSPNANNQLFGIYTLDIYETQSDGDRAISESYNVSFDPNMVDDSGESIFIEDVVNKFSANIRVEVNRDALRELENYKLEFYKNDPTLPSYVTQYTVLDENGQMTDLGYKATMIEFALMDYNYAVFMLNEALAALAEARQLPSSTQQEIIDRNAAISAALSDVSTQRVELALTKVALDAAYALDIMSFGDADVDTPGVQPWSLTQGSEGSLVYLDKTTGKTVVQPDEADQLLSQAYLGLLTKPDDPPKVDPTNGSFRWVRTQYVDEVFDLDWIYFSLVYDAGYGVNPKNAALTLASIYRMDCMLISDCGDNIDFYDCQEFVGGDPSNPSGLLWNSKYAARYEPYSRIYDAFTGRDLWITPVYHMAQLMPLNDRLYEIWYASAGFNRATLDTVKELRWSAKLGERDNLYLLQVNPIVHFPQGYTVWGNLTTQKRPSSLQDVNVMRLVLYIKRAIEQYCKYFIFEFNDAVTHSQIKAGIIPFLDSIQARRGLVNFSVEVGATEWEFKNKICHVNVTLTPMKVIEKIELNLFIK